MNTQDHHSSSDRALALAGIYQALLLVQQTGRGLYRDETATGTTIGSIFITDPPHTAAVFGGAIGVRAGLEQLVSQLENQAGARNLELTAYLVTLLHLERKLTRRRMMLETLASGISNISAATDHVLDATVIEALAGLYQQTISTLTPRVMVQGEPVILANPETQHMIRALLLGALRAAVLWRQCGGTRLRLILERKALLAAARDLLREATVHT